MQYENLKYLGLLEPEINVFEILLELGLAKVSEIQTILKLPRTTIYGILDNLIKKGFVSYLLKSRVKHYKVTDLQNILQKEEEKLIMIKETFSELKKKQTNLQEEVIVEQYVGREGFKTIFEDILKTKTNEYYAYGNVGWIMEQTFLPNQIIRRVHENKKLFAITEDSKSAREMKKNDKLVNRETRFITNINKMKSAKYIYGDKVITIASNGRDLIGIIIKSKEIYNIEKFIFDSLWKNAKK